MAAGGKNLKFEIKTEEKLDELGFGQLKGQKKQKTNTRIHLCKQQSIVLNEGKHVNSNQFFS